MPRFIRPLVFMVILLIFLLSGLWLALESQLRSSFLSLNQSFLFLAGTALGFLILSIEGIRLVLPAKKEANSSFSLLSLFLLAYILPAVLLILPGFLTSGSANLLFQRWLDPLPSFTLAIQSSAAGLLLMIRYPSRLAAWLGMTVPQKGNLHLWLTGLVCGLGAAISCQFLLFFYQSGISSIFTDHAGEAGIFQTGMQAEFWSLPPLSKVLILTGGVLFAPLTAGFLFRQVMCHQRQETTKLPADPILLFFFLGIAFLYGVLHLNPFTIVPAFLLMLLLFSLDNLTHHPLPGLLTHASVNLLACLIDWRWMF